MIKAHDAKNFIFSMFKVILMRNDFFLVFSVYISILYKHKSEFTIKPNPHNIPSLVKHGTLYNQGRGGPSFYWLSYQHLINTAGSE